MIKQKLISKRKEKGLSQEEMAFRLGIEQSQYCRRESGKTKISKKEWEAMAKVLDTSLEEIYEPQDDVYVINNENANEEYSGSQNHFNSIPDYMLDTLKKYIQKLEEEIAVLKERIEEK